MEFLSITGGKSPLFCYVGFQISPVVAGGVCAASQGRGGHSETPEPTAPATASGDRISPSTSQQFPARHTALQTRSEEEAPAPAPWCGQPRPWQLPPSASVSHILSPNPAPGPPGTPWQQRCSSCAAPPPNPAPSASCSPQHPQTSPRDSSSQIFRDGFIPLCLPHPPGGSRGCSGWGLLSS